MKNSRICSHGKTSGALILVLSKKKSLFYFQKALILLAEKMRQDSPRYAQLSSPQAQDVSAVS